jgi:hypothetical protein
MDRMEELALPGLATSLGLGAVLGKLLDAHGGYDMLAHWKQGEFHHDLLVHVPRHAAYLIVSTNCNGGLKELIRFAEAPQRWALWHWRCPDNPEFGGLLPEILERVTTVHYFNPCEVLAADARSEIRPEFRRRMRGGGWELADEDKD